MNWTVLRALIFLLTLSHFNTAHAEDASASGNFFLSPSLLYYSGLRTRSSEEKKSYLVYDAKIAYRVYDAVFAGLTYQVENENIDNSGYSSAALNNSSKSVRTSVGPSVGYITSTGHALLTYFMDSKWNLDTTSSSGQNKYNYTGSGFQLDLGYKIPFLGIFFGPQLSYKSFTYLNLSTNGSSVSTISPKLEETSIEPSLVLFYFF